MRICISCKTNNTPSAFCDDCIRQKATPLKPEHAAAVRARMDKDGESGPWYYYLFYSGEVLSPEEVAALTTSRIAQLVSINRDGIPQLVGRRFMDVIHPKLEQEKP